MYKKGTLNCWFNTNSSSTAELDPLHEKCPEPVLTACTANNNTAITTPCKCGGATFACDAGKYCWNDGSCMGSKPPSDDDSLNCTRPQNHPGYVIDGDMTNENFNSKTLNPGSGWKCAPGYVFNTGVSEVTASACTTESSGYNLLGCKEVPVKQTAAEQAPAEQAAAEQTPAEQAASEQAAEQAVAVQAAAEQVAAAEQAAAEQVAAEQAVAEQDTTTDAVEEKKPSGGKCTIM